MTQVVLVIKNLPAKAGDRRYTSFISGLGRFPGEGNCNPLQCSCLENLTNRGTWQTTVHGVIRVRHDLVTKPPPQSSGHVSEDFFTPKTYPSFRHIVHFLVTEMHSL